MLRRALPAIWLIAALLAAPLTAAAPAQALRVQVGRQDVSISNVGRIAFSPDGRLVAAALNQGTSPIVLFDAASGVLVRRFDNPAGETADAAPVWLAFARQGAALVTLDMQGAVRLWDVASGRLLRTSAERMEGVVPVAIAQNGDRLAAADAAGRISVWAVDSGRREAAFRMPGDAPVVGGLALSRAGGRIAVFDSSSRKIRVLDARSGQVVREIASGFSAIEALAFTEAGTGLVAKAAARLRAWDIATGREDASLSLDHGNAAARATPLLAALHAGAGLLDVASPDTRRFLSLDDPESPARDFGLLVLGDTASGRALRRIAETSINPNGAQPISTAFAPDGKRFALAAYDGALRVYESATGRRLFEVGEVKANAYAVSALAISADGRQIAAGRTAVALPGEAGYATLQVWGAATGALVRTWLGLSNGVGAVAFSSNGLQLTGAGLDETLRRYEIAGGREVRGLGSGRDFYAIALSQDARTAVLVGDDNGIRALDLSTMKATPVMPAAPERVASVSLSADGRVVATLDASGRVAVRQTDGRGPGRSFRAEGATVSGAVALSQDGSALVVAAGPTLRLWDLASGNLRRESADDGTARALALSADGTRLAEGGEGATIRVREAKTGTPLVTLLPIGTADWAAVTPEGYFSVSPGGRGKLMAIDGLDVRPLAQAHPELERPDVVAARLAGKSAAPGEAAAGLVLRIAVAP